MNFWDQTKKGKTNLSDFGVLLDPATATKKMLDSVMFSTSGNTSKVSKTPALPVKNDLQKTVSHKNNQAESKKQSNNTWFMTTKKDKNNPLTFMDDFRKGFLGIEDDEEEDETAFLTKPTQKERDFAESFLDINRKENDTRSGFEKAVDTASDVVGQSASAAKNFNWQLDRFYLPKTRNAASPGSRKYAPDTILVDNRLLVPSKEFENSQAYKKAMEIYKKHFPDQYKKATTPGKIRLSNGEINVTGAKHLLQSDAVKPTAKKIISKVDGAEIPKSVRTVLNNADDLAKLKSIAKSGGKALGRVGNVLTAIDLGTTAYEDLTDEDGKLSTKTGKAITSTIADFAGGWAGAKLGSMGGAAIGTMICPVIGTAIGGIIGAIAGGMLGSWGASYAAEQGFDALENIWFGEDY